MTNENELIRRGAILELCQTLEDEAPSGSYDNGGTTDGWMMACRRIEKAIAALPAVAASQTADPVINAHSRQRVTVKPLDLINRMDAIQACQVGPSDEWSKATKSGYEQAATDCARNILKISPAAIDVQTDPRDAQIAALVEALEAYKGRAKRIPFSVAWTQRT